MMLFRAQQSARSSRRSQLLTFGLATLTLIGLASLPSLKPTTANTSHAAMILVKKPAEIQKCYGCHGADLKGRKGFSPSLTKSGVIKIYSNKAFETVMNTGKTSHGGMVKPPMPVYHDTAAVADSMYKYLNTLP